MISEKNNGDKVFDISDCIVSNTPLLMLNFGREVYILWKENHKENWYTNVQNVVLSLWKVCLVYMQTASLWILLFLYKIVQPLYSENRGLISLGMHNSIVRIYCKSPYSHDNTYIFPAGTHHWNNIETTLIRRHDVELTLIQCCFNVCTHRFFTHPSVSPTSTPVTAVIVGPTRLYSVSIVVNASLWKYQYDTW